MGRKGGKKFFWHVERREGESYNNQKCGGKKETKGNNKRKGIPTISVVMIIIASVLALVSPVQAWDGDIWWGGPAFDYAPNMWFGSAEELYPTSPFFDDEDLSGEDNKNDYYNLSFDQKMDNFVVYYHIAETEHEWVIEYWFYYAYNDWINKHYHDWETVYVFYNKATGNVTRVVASAHTDATPNNEYFNPQFAEEEHAGILVEEGSHASCTDSNNNGFFERGIDLTNGFIPEAGLPPFAWGIWDRDQNDVLYGYRIAYDSPFYSLKDISIDFIGKFGGLKKFDDPTLGFPVEVPISGGIYYVPIGGEPPTHPWNQSRYHNPYEIIPILDRFISGNVSGSDTTGAIVVILSEEPSYTFADENGNFLVNNVSQGLHDAVVNLDGYAPYKQRFIHKGNTSLGVNGTLYIIPESEAFRIEGTVTDVKENIVSNTTINVYDENNIKMFTTLTDNNGTYLVTASAENVYTVEALFGYQTGLRTGISGETGNIVKTDIVLVGPAQPDLRTVEYKWGEPAPGYGFEDWPIFESWMNVRIENGGEGDAFNVTATLSSWSANVEIVDGEATGGDISAGTSAWSFDTFRLRTDMTNPVDPDEGVFWNIEYDDSAGVHHLIEDVPEFPE